jgi:hypothetical protein
VSGGYLPLSAQTSNQMYLLPAGYILSFFTQSQYICVEFSVNIGTVVPVQRMEVEVANLCSRKKLREQKNNKGRENKSGLEVVSVLEKCKGERIWCLIQPLLISDLECCVCELGCQVLGPSSHKYLLFLLPALLTSFLVLTINILCLPVPSATGIA